MPHHLVRNFLVAWKAPRWRWAFLTAVLSDLLGFGVALFPPGQWLLDAATAVVLFAVLGFRWSLVTALAVEAVPALQLFPAWTLVVMALAALETEDRLKQRTVEPTPKQLTQINRSADS